MTNAYACNVVIDLEFTPVPRRLRSECGLQCEIVEVGAVKVAANGTVLDEFSQLVKPTYSHGVSGIVHSMTGICDEDLVCARPLAQVLGELAAWIGTGRARMVTWSGSDLVQVSAECLAKGIDVALPHRWLDIQRLYPRLAGLPKRCVALGEAADWCGIANDKALAHRALYDARMTADIFAMMAHGDIAAQREVMSSQAHDHATGCTASVASSCDGLAELLARLQAQEARAA